MDLVRSRSLGCAQVVDRRVSVELFLDKGGMFVSRLRIVNDKVVDEIERNIVKNEVLYNKYIDE